MTSFEWLAIHFFGDRARSHETRRARQDAKTKSRISICYFFFSLKGSQRETKRSFMEEEGVSRGSKRENVREDVKIMRVFL